MRKLLLACAIGTALIATACGSSAIVTTRGGLVVGSFENADLSSKDYEGVQMVFAETLVGDTTNANMTYNALLKEAAKVGAHDIINVVIEDVQICEGEASFFSRSSSCTTTRYGSALAIRYTKPLSVYELRVDEDMPLPPDACDDDCRARMNQAIMNSSANYNANVNVNSNANANVNVNNGSVSVSGSLSVDGQQANVNAAVKASN